MKWERWTRRNWLPLIHLTIIDWSGRFWLCYHLDFGSLGEMHDLRGQGLTGSLFNVILSDTCWVAQWEVWFMGASGAKNTIKYMKWHAFNAKKFFKILSNTVLENIQNVSIFNTFLLGQITPFYWDISLVLGTFCAF